jgi:hypothetical protein
MVYILSLPCYLKPTMKGENLTAAVFVVFAIAAITLMKPSLVSSAARQGQEFASYTYEAVQDALASSGKSEAHAQAFTAAKYNSDPSTETAKKGGAGLKKIGQD